MCPFLQWAWTFIPRSPYRAFLKTSEMNVWKDQGTELSDEMGGESTVMWKYSDVEVWRKAG